MKIELLMNIARTDPMPVGGRLKHFTKVWKKVIQDQWANRLLQKGLTINLIANLGKSPHEEYVLNSEDAQMLDQELMQMLSKDTVEECPEGSQRVISPMFVVVQKKKKRPVWDGQHINTFTKKEHFKMESLGTVKETIMIEDWMTVLDIKDAFFHISLSTEAMKYLQFCWKGKIYWFKYMPFGISAAPRIFTKIIKLVLAELRISDLRIVSYIDNFLIFGRSKQKAL